MRLGETAEDSLTGLNGTIVGRATYLHGGDQLQLQPREVNEGKPVCPTWFVASRLRPVAKERMGLSGTTTR